mmetsp:Transcript_43743/g.79853  ORF Transcript_43743/g.79853 Transcript_43743/m.79853 type:complete len:380 (-) Transcript_43743:58-1197(-)
MGASPSQLFEEVDRASREVGAGPSNDLASAIRSVQDMFLTGKCGSGADDGDMALEVFANPICRGEDPWIIRHQGLYYWCHSINDLAIGVSTSSSLHGPWSQSYTVWKAPSHGPYSQEVWAPELHYLDGSFYIYFAASDGDNATHLAYVLSSEDPLGPYTLHGPLATGDGHDGCSPNMWAIDLTVLHLNGEMFAVWSGWDHIGSDQQYLYIAPMADPVTICGPRVRLCDNGTYAWERIHECFSSKGLNEGPQVLQMDDRTFIVYSCGASWLPTYKLGLLELVGSDPLDADSWVKHSKPAFLSSKRTFGVGHSCFVPSPDGRELWHVYHSKTSPTPGWSDRRVFMQPMHFEADGMPDFGAAVEPGEVLPCPSDRHRLSFWN